MTMILGGTNPAVTFPDNTVQNTAVGSPSVVGQIPFSTDGTSYTSTAKIVSGTAVASTSGTNIDFTSIPSWVKRITVMFHGVSTNGASLPIVRAGTSGGIVATGYTQRAIRMGGAQIDASDAGTTGFSVVSSAATNAVIATMLLNNVAGNVWVASLNGYSQGNDNSLFGSGNVTLSGTLDRVRITTVNGTDTFDAGTINILYE